MLKVLNKKRVEILWIGIVVLHVLLLLKTTFFPYPELFVYPYLTKIGLLPYKEIFDQHFPGLMFFPLNFATLGIVTPTHFRIVQVVLVLVTHAGIFQIVRKKNIQPMYLFLISFLYLCWQGYYEGGTLWIESILVPLLVWLYYFVSKALSERKARDFAIAGLLLGIATITKQIVIPMGGLLFLYIFLNEKNKKNVVHFVLSAGIPVMIMLLYVFEVGVFKDFLYWAGTFNFTAYHDMGRKYPTIKEILSTLFISFPAVWGLISLLKDHKQRSEGVLLGIFFFTGFLYAYARFDYIHLQPIIPFALLLFIFGSIRSRYKFLVLCGFFVFSSIVGVRSYWRNWGIETKFFASEDYFIFEKVNEYAKPGSSVFAFGTYPYIYPETNTHPAGNVFVFQFPWFMKIAEQPILNGLVADPPVVIIRDSTAMTDTYNLISYMPKISEFVDRYYQVTETIGSTEILTKK